MATKSQKPRAVLIVGIIAVLVAVIASLLLYRYMVSQESKVIESVSTEEVIVATSDISVGSVIKTGQVARTAWPKTAMPEGALSSVEQAGGRVALLTIKAGDPITEVKLIPLEGATGILSYKIPKGHRAMTVAVDKVSGVAGFITPGNMVDLVVTTKPAGYKEPVSKIFLQNVPVLATGNILEQLPEGEAVEVPTVTLDVMPVEAEMLAVASITGKLQLLLRRSGDDGSIATKGISVRNVVRGSAVHKKQAAVAKKTTVKKRVKRTGSRYRTLNVKVEVLRNADVSIERFKVKEAVK